MSVRLLPRLTLLPCNDCESVARDGFILGVFIKLLAGTLCINVAGTFSVVVSEAEKGDEMAEVTDIKEGLDEPGK